MQSYTNPIVWNKLIQYLQTTKPPYSYKIMCPKQLKGVDKDKKATEIIIKFIDLPEDQYRLGNTKVYDRQYILNIHSQDYIIRTSFFSLNIICTLSRIQFPDLLFLNQSWQPFQLIVHSFCHRLG